MIWPNVDLLVHRFDSVLRNFQVKYSTDEYWECKVTQYGTNDWRDLSALSPGVDDLPSAKLVSEHGPEHSPRLHSPS